MIVGSSRGRLVIPTQVLDTMYTCMHVVFVGQPLSRCLVQRTYPSIGRARFYLLLIVVPPQGFRSLI